MLSRPSDGTPAVTSPNAHTHHTLNRPYLRVRNRPGRQAKGDEKETENSKIYLRGLPWDTPDADVKDFFKACGKIVSVEQPKNPDGRSSGTAYVVFDSAAAAAKAVEMDGQELGGRWLKIMMSFEKPNHARAGEPKVKPEGCTTVFIGNLSWSIDEVRMVGRKSGGEGRWTGTVQYRAPHEISPSIDRFFFGHFSLRTPRDGYACARVWRVCSSVPQEPTLIVGVGGREHNLVRAIPTFAS